MTDLDAAICRLTDPANMRGFTPRHEIGARADRFATVVARQDDLQTVIEAARAAPGSSANPTEPAQTYSVRRETRPAIVRHMIGAEPPLIIRADPLLMQREDGGTSIRMGFPVLIVTDLVDEAEAFAEKLATLLHEARL